MGLLGGGESSSLLGAWGGDDKLNVSFWSTSEVARGLWTV